MRKSFYTIWTFARLNSRRFFRDKLAMFFVIVFPLIFLFVFGGIFGGSDAPTFNVALVNQSQTEFAQTFSGQLNDSEIFKVSDDTNFDSAEESLRRGQLDAIIVLPPEFGQLDKKAGYPTGEAEVVFTQDGQAAGQTLVAVLEGVFDEVNAEFVDTSVPFTVVSTTTNVNGLSRFDYTFSGMLGFSIIGLGIFGPVNVFPELKKQGILRRFHTTTLKVWQYFVANVLSNMSTGLVAVAVMFLVALTVFDLKIAGSVLALAIFIAFSTAMIYGIGLAIGGWAKNERQAAPLSNIVVFPMMFLSGTFFPRYLMPEWLQTASNFLPLTPVIDGIRLILTEGQTLVQVGPQLLQISLWMIVIYFIAFRVFRWE